MYQLVGKNVNYFCKYAHFVDFTGKGLETVNFSYDPPAAGSVLSLQQGCGSNLTAGHLQATLTKLLTY